MSFDVDAATGEEGRAAARLKSGIRSAADAAAGGLDVVNPGTGSVVTAAVHRFIREDHNAKPNVHDRDLSTDARKPNRTVRFQSPHAPACRRTENTMHRETLTYQADGLTMKSELFFEPGGGRRAGVLVYPEAYGLNEHAFTRAERLASMGYTALACDLHGEARVVDDLQVAIGMLGALYADPSKTRARAIGGMRALMGRSEVDPARLATIGFCFGGTTSLELARSGADIKAVVGFHSGLATVAPKSDAKAIKARILVCIGADDPFIPPEQRAAFETEMRDGGVDWQMHLYGNTVHSFTIATAANANRPDALRYSAEADKRSWHSMQELFVEALA
jgi:dienelactone hydrolase